jgi:hypothetical protein
VWNISIDDILKHLNRLEEITCDQDLESHLLTTAIPAGLCPKLKMINQVSITVSADARKH